MCRAIKEYHARTGRRVGFKPAGGINTVADAVAYYTIVKEILGAEWLTPGLYPTGRDTRCPGGRRTTSPAGAFYAVAAPSGGISGA